VWVYSAFAGTMFSIRRTTVTDLTVRCYNWDIVSDLWWSLDFARSAGNFVFSRIFQCRLSGRHSHVCATDSAAQHRTLAMNSLNWGLELWVRY